MNEILIFTKSSNNGHKLTFRNEITLYNFISKFSVVH